jgi:hypothetical protein
MSQTEQQVNSSLPWDTAAQGWNQHSLIIRTWLGKATQAMLDSANITVGMSVLDVAAGAGDQSLAIAQRIGPQGRVLATDISASILAHAKENARREGYGQIDTLVADAQHLGLQGQNFDAAVCRLGLMFCNSPQLALVQVRQALRPGAYFSALVFAGPETNPCIATTLGIARQYAGLTKEDELDQKGAQRHSTTPGGLLSLGSPGMLAALLGNAGYVSIKVTAFDAPFRLRNVDAYITFLRSAASPLIEILSTLTSSQQAATWNEMRIQLKRYDHPDGWVGPNELLLCQAQVPY